MIFGSSAIFCRFKWRKKNSRDDTRERNIEWESEKKKQERKKTIQERKLIQQWHERITGCVERVRILAYIIAVAGCLNDYDFAIQL